MLETDPACGPGRYSLTRLTLALAQVAAPAPVLSVELYAADAAGVPTTLLGVTSATVAAPMVPAYSAVALSSLQFTTSSALGANFSVVLSASAPLRWLRAASASPVGLPAAGAASVYGLAQSGDGGGSWTALSPYPAAALWAIKTVCSPSATVTSTLTPSASASQSSSATQTATYVARPLAPAVDNTNGSGAPIFPGAVRSISATTWRAVSLLWPEVDPTCGPGRYTLSSLILALSQDGSLPGNTLSLHARLYSLDPVTAAPSALLRSALTFPSVFTTPSYVTVRVALVEPVLARGAHSPCSAGRTPVMGRRYDCSVAVCGRPLREQSCLMARR